MAEWPAVWDGVARFLPVYTDSTPFYGIREELMAIAAGRQSQSQRRLAVTAMAIALCGCGPQPVSVEEAYRRAVQDAAIAEASEIATDLVAIRRDNPQLVWNDAGDRILVATWKSRQAYEQFLQPYDSTSENPDYAVWVTTVPEVRAHCAAWARQAGVGEVGLDLRLKQYLGLAPAWHYDLFVEFWVEPQRLFRPCVDPQTDDSSCRLHFDGETPVVANIPDYRDFYRDLYFRSFRGSDGVPWTGLGYTYDWGNPDTEVGASEFILMPGAPYEIKSVTPTAHYCGG
ncbi:hypothetical protein [Marinobacterium nitratireducens]|nr:hypothetical protein [Marinobacterium nitratireducens]